MTKSNSVVESPRGKRKIAKMNAMQQQLLNASTDELFELLGRDLVGKQAFPLSSEELIERAKGWFSAQTGRIQAVICTPSVAEGFIVDSDERKLMLALADLLLKAHFGVGPVTLSSLVVKIGLKKFCNWP
jgi:hypothetical protein